MSLAQLVRTGVEYGLDRDFLCRLPTKKAVRDSVRAQRHREQSQVDQHDETAEWQWPTWLRAGWIAMDSDGKWHAFDAKPTHNDADWWVESYARADGGVRLASELFDFTPPPCDDWKTSLRRNPNP